MGLISAARQVFEIVARAKGAVAGSCYDRHGLRLVRSELIERVVKFKMRRRVKRVEHLGPVDGYNGDGVVLFHDREFMSQARRLPFRMDLRDAI